MGVPERPGAENWRMRVPNGLVSAMRKAVAAADARAAARQANAEEDERARKLAEIVYWKGIYPDVVYDDGTGGLRSEMLANNRVGVDDGAKVGVADGDTGNGRKQRKGFWRGKPKTNQEWIELADSREPVGTQVVHREIGSGRFRGAGILHALRGESLERRYVCGCLEKVNKKGESYWSRCGHDDCETV